MNAVPTRSLLLVLAACLCLGMTAAQSQDNRQEPVAFFGHGAMFDRKGTQVAPTAAFVRDAQAWYRNSLAAKLNKEQKVQFDRLQAKLSAGLKLDAPSQFVLNANLIDWLIKTVKPDNRAHLQGVNNLLRSFLAAGLPQSADVRHPGDLKTVQINPELLKRLAGAGLSGDKNPPIVFLTTTNGGALYRQECADNGVPVPATVGGANWTDRGEIPQSELFIVTADRANVMTYTPTMGQPEGMCIALPRYKLEMGQLVVKLDGVICLGKVSRKACFWDNEKNGAVNTFVLGTVVPLSDFGGGTELIGPTSMGGGGVCSDCHSGENPYIIHGALLYSLAVPAHSLSGAPLSLPTFPDDWTIPIVRSGDSVVWPENPGPMNSSATPNNCDSCHTQSFAGRFPHLSPLLDGYCNTVLRLAVEGQAMPAIPATMPPSAPGSLKNDPDVITFRGWCGIPSDGTTSDRGDPHITTFNGVHYDFQSAGEFTAMRGDNGMEVQTRQTPVGTSTTPLANAYNGLTSCVSLNTAFAARVGTHRVSFEPNISGAPDPSGMQLRIDGVLTVLPPQGVNLGNGGRIARPAAGDGIELFFPNGTHMVVTSNWWGAPHNKWYLNVDVLKTTAREGVMGAVLPGNWLPVLSNGKALGARPAAAHQRYVQLYQTFANAWRVTNATSLFDYAPGTSTADFTNTAWPVENPTSCAIPKDPPTKPIDPKKAAVYCAEVADRHAKAECIFDVSVLGDPVFAKGYIAAQRARARAAADGQK